LPTLIHHRITYTILQCPRVQDTGQSIPQGPQLGHLTRHPCPLVRAIQSILKKANKKQRRCPPSFAVFLISEIIHWRRVYRHAPHVCLESSLSLPAGSLLCGLNSRWVAMTGHTIGGGQFDKLEQSVLHRPSSKPGCLPSRIWFHTLRIASELRISVQWSRKYLTSTYSSLLAAPSTWIKTTYLTNNFEGG
jgi:hypothetical protein